MAVLSDVEENESNDAQCETMGLESMSCVEIVTHTYVDVKLDFADNGVIIISHSSFFIPHYEDLSGGYCSGVPPLPIPNREVKPACADGTAMQCGRVGGRHLFKK